MLRPPSATGQWTALGEVGDSLRQLGYTASGLSEALGSEGPLVEGRTVGDRRRRARRAGAVGVLARLLLMGERLTFDECRPLPPTTLDRLLESGLLGEDGGHVEASVGLVPHDDLLVAADRLGSDAGADIVPGVQPPSFLLGCLTIRAPVQRALDLGTGCGIQALLLSAFAGQVVATDVSERALQFAELNAALNHRRNITFRQGDLFEAVKGETFGLLVSNPPYVISPDNAFTYRDSARGGEQIGADVVEGAGGHLDAGGHATILVSWDASGADPLERPRSWIPPGCDALVLGSARDIEVNAERWNVGPDRDSAVERWIQYFEGRGISHVGYGAVVLRKRESEYPLVRSLEIGDQIDRPAGRVLQRMFDARRVTSEDRVRLVGTARVSDRSRLDAAGWVVEDRELMLLDGLGFHISLDDETAALVEALDGRPLPSLGADALAYVDRLVSLGFAEIC